MSARSAIVENDGDLRGLDLAFAAFLHYFVLFFDDFAEFGHRKDLENARFLALILFVDEFDEGLVLFVQAHRWAEKEDALKQGFPGAGNVEFAEDINQYDRFPSTGGHYQGKR